MISKPISFSKADIREMLRHLDASTTIIEKHAGELSAMELSLKSMLGAIKRELEEQLRSHSGLDE
jgi:hypothetical protein